MKPPAKDPDLTAQVLKELPPGKDAAMAELLAASPELQAEAAAIAELAVSLSRAFPTSSLKLHPAQRQTILKRAREADQQRRPSPLSAPAESIQSWIIPSAAAAVLVLATAIFIHMSNREAAQTARENPKPDPGKSAPDRRKPAPAPHGPAAAMPAGPFTPASHPALELPVQRGQPGLDGFTTFIGRGQLPPPESVRIGDVLNTFSYRFNGVTSIARPALQPGQGPAQPLAILTTEFIACPWKPSATLLFIAVRGGPAAPASARLVFRPDPAGVARFRLLGSHAPAVAPPPATARPSPALPANASATLVLEIDPQSSEGRLGELEWQVNGQAAPAIPLVYKRSTEPSDDARFAALATTWCQWLTREHAGLIDTEILAALSREIQSATLPADRAEFLRLVESSLKL